MKHARKLMILALVLAVSASVAQLALAQDNKKPHWTYEGEEGPDHWGDLDPSYELCSVGNFQSPIDLVDPITSDQPDISFSDEPSPLKVTNNGHTIQVNYAEGQGSISYEDVQYNLVQFHFHHPSEHLVDGEAAPMELHLVHADAQGNLAVVGVLLTVGEEDNSAFAPIFDNLPAEANTVTDTGLMINAAELLPENKTYATYSGSLTTPPCSQGVLWLVLTDPVEISEAQVETFAALFELNARPVQPVNEREVVEDSN